MGNVQSAKIHSDAPLYDVVDDFLKDRVEDVVRSTIKSKADKKYALNLKDIDQRPIASIFVTPRRLFTHNFEKTQSPDLNISPASTSVTPTEYNAYPKLPNKFGLTIQITNNSPMISSRAGKTKIDAIRSVQALAKRHNSRQQNSYIPQDVLSSFVSTQLKRKHSAHVPGSDNQSKPTAIVSFKKSSSNSIGSGYFSRQPSKRSKGNEDEEDWIQVSDDEYDMSVETPRLRDTLSLHKTRQSYVFTNSGTIFVDGFTAGIGKNGIQTSVRELKLPMKERLLVLCRLGQGASSVVYKALDVAEMKLVALKMVSVFDRSKRRQMVRELGTLFAMLRKRQKELQDLQTKDVRSFTPMAIRISSRPCSRDPNTPQPASFYMPSLGRLPDTSPTDSDPHISLCATNCPEVTSVVSEQTWAHIVDFYDAFSNLEDGGVALMMEYLDGGSLQDIVEQGGCSDEHTLASIAKQALSGLEFLHSCNQLHRDLKPANMLINQVGDVKISDFGIIRQLSGEDAVPLPQQVDYPQDGDGEGMQRAYTFVGTMTYMAPERIDGRDYSFPSDVWSLGLSLLTLALGRLPLDTKGGFWSILHCIRDMAPPTLPADGDWSPEFRDFLSQCLKHDPNERATCLGLLKHAFISKACRDPDTVPADNGVQELRTIIRAVYEHVTQLDDVGGSVLLEACRDQERDRNIMDTVYRIIFAENINIENMDSLALNFEFKTDSLSTTPSMQSCSVSSPPWKIEAYSERAHARLGLLASQLHIPVATAVTEAQQLFRELVRERNGGSRMSVLATPKAYHGGGSDINNSIAAARHDIEKNSLTARSNQAVCPVSPLASMMERRLCD